jgi:hypothetical protein
LPLRAIGRRSAWQHPPKKNYQGGSSYVQSNQRCLHTGPRVIIGTGDAARRYPATGQLGHESRRRVRRGHDTSQRCLRVQTPQTSGSQVCAMEWNYLHEILLNRHRDHGFGADWSKHEAASVGGLFHSIRNVRCPILALSGRCSAADQCLLLTYTVEKVLRIKLWN